MYELNIRFPSGFVVYRGLTRDQAIRGTLAVRKFPDHWQAMWVKQPDGLIRMRRNPRKVRAGK